MRGLAPGDYVVRVRLTVAAGTGWRGEAVSKAVPLKVVAPSPAPQRVTQRALSLANEALLANRGEEAAGILDAVLRFTPDSREALVLRAIVADRAGNLPAALLCVNRAARGLSANGFPPAELYELRSRLQTKFIQPPAAGEIFNPPAWSWPPASVLTAAEDPKPSPTNRGAATVSAPAASKKTPDPDGIPAFSPSGPAASRPAPPSDAVGRGAVVPSAELSDARVIANAAGQWATSARAGSEYGRTQYSAMQATGAPNISVAGNSADAWCPEGKNTGMDWLEVGFAQPVHATEVRIRQNDTIGAIAKIEAIEPDGTIHVWWEGIDPYKKSAVREIVWFAVRVPKTAYLVAKVKITLNLAATTGWKEIDAVQLVGVAP